MALAFQAYAVVCATATTEKRWEGGAAARSLQAIVTALLSVRKKHSTDRQSLVIALGKGVKA